MQQIEGDDIIEKVNKSELAIANEMGQLFYYSSESIRLYMQGCLAALEKNTSNHTLTHCALR